MEERKGFFTKEQEKQLDGLIELKGLAETVDGIAIRIADNAGLERLKSNIPEDMLPIIYEVIDEIMNTLSAITKE